MAFQHKKPAFTLIELLVVIAIVGLLAALIGFGLLKYQKTARDAKRKADLSLVVKAMEEAKK